jgi:hypothetical protein
MAQAYPLWKFIADLQVTDPNSADGFQVQYTINWMHGMAVDFRDLRFSSIKGAKLSYWIQEQTNGVSAIVWVALPADDKKIYMHYGNGVAQSESDIWATMEHGDDFTHQATLDTSRWDTSPSNGTANINNGVLEFTPSVNSEQKFYMKKDGVNKDYNGDYIVTARIKNPSSASNSRLGLSFCSSPMGYAVVLAYQDNFGFKFLNDTITWGTTWASGAINTWYTISGRYAGSQLWGKKDDGSWNTQSWSGRSGYTALYIGHVPGVVSYVDYVFVRKYAATEPTLSLTRSRQNPSFQSIYVSTGAVDILSAGTDTEVKSTVLIDRITSGDTTEVTGMQAGLMDCIPGDSIAEVLSNDNFIDKVVQGTTLGVSPGMGIIKVFTDMDNYNVEAVTVSKSINDAMWQLTATIDGTVSPAEFRHLNYSRADHDGVDRHLFTGIVPDTRYTLQVAQNKIDVTAFDYGWYLSAQYVPTDLLVMNLDGDKSTWDEWVAALLDETGITAYRMTTCSAVPDKEFVFDDDTTKLDAIEEIAEATGFIFTVRWVQSGNLYIPAAYFIDPADIDDASTGLDLPAAETIAWPDDTLVAIPTLQSPTDEKINRVKVRGCDSDGNWYSATLESSDVTAGATYPREYYYESGDLASQAKVNARAAALYAYFTSDSYIIEATFKQRYDLQLFQKIRFTGSGFPEKLTDLGWLRIISITYSAKAAEDRVTIKAVVNRDIRLILSEINTYLQDGVSEDELLIDSALSSLNITPLVGTVQSISDNIATILTEDGRTIKARILT